MNKTNENRITIHKAFKCKAYIWSNEILTIKLPQKESPYTFKKLKQHSSLIYYCGLMNSTFKIELSTSIKELYLCRLF